MWGSGASTLRSKGFMKIIYAGILYKLNHQSVGRVGKIIEHLKSLRKVQLR